MRNINKNDFLNRSVETLEQILGMFDKLPVISLKELQGSKTALIIVDMINGFTREGALKSPRIEKIIPQIANLSKMCNDNGIIKLAFADCHTNASPEFDAYPPHCIKGSCEVEIVDELKEIGGYTLISKNSTNGFLEEDFFKWLMDNKNIDTFIITGDCTDICIQQFAITLKTWFNMKNKKARVIVPINAVETYDLELHNGDLMNVMSLYNMMGNGVEIVKSVD
ncbi:UNVERIFIED_CONTAM: nicotinamidase-related amidase [Acetivibrio alkalicellulosi]